MQPAIDQVVYLNEGTPAPFISRLLEQLTHLKQGRASAAQWASTVRAFTQKGVKAIELEESGAQAYLQSLPASQMLSKDELIDEIKRRYYTVKEVLLGAPRYRSYSQAGGEYREYLYIANSERDNIDDELAAVNWEMEELAFDPSRILDDPSLVVQLEKRRERLMSKRQDAIEFTQHHFSDKVSAAYGKNLLAHCRVTIHGSTYFINEVQSDWAQRGRKSNWNRIVKGPLVTSTEAWAGMVLRRHLQIAASMPAIQQVAWITESMRNGGHQSLQREADKEAQRKAFREFMAEETRRQLQAIGAAGMTPEQHAEAQKLVNHAVTTAAAAKGLYEPMDMLNDFYLQVLPKLADKALGKSGARTAFKEIALSSQHTAKVPCIELNEIARQQLIASQPLYSRAPLRLDRIDLSQRDHEIARAIARTREMLGSAKHLRLAKHVYDLSSGRRVAGHYVNRMLEVSLQAHDLVEVVEHECLHFAVDNLLQPNEIEMLRSAFSPGTTLNLQVRQALQRRGMFEAALQCSNVMEAAAHGFTLWQRGLVQVDEPTVKGLFSDLVTLVRDGLRWLRRTVLEHRCTSVEEVFSALSGGDLAEQDNEVAEALTPALLRQRPTG